MDKVIHIHSNRIYEVKDKTYRGTSLHFAPQLSTRKVPEPVLQRFFKVYQGKEEPNIEGCKCTIPEEIKWEAEQTIKSTVSIPDLSKVEEKEPLSKKIPKPKKIEPKPTPSSNTVTIGDICDSLGISASEGRRRLRKNKIEKPTSGRWEWNTKDSEKIKKLLK